MGDIILNLFVNQDLMTTLALVITVLGGVITVLHGIIAICIIIPGEEPERTLQKTVDALQKFVDFISRFSKK